MLHFTIPFLIKILLNSEYLKGSGKSTGEGIELVFNSKFGSIKKHQTRESMVDFLKLNIHHYLKPNCTCQYSCQKRDLVFCRSGLYRDVYIILSFQRIFSFIWTSVDLSYRNIHRSKTTWLYNIFLKIKK